MVVWNGHHDHLTATATTDQLILCVSQQQVLLDKQDPKLYIRLYINYLKDKIGQDKIRQVDLLAY